VVRTDDREVEGKAEDLDPQGALLVRGDDGALHRFVAGDVSLLRPR